MSQDKLTLTSMEDFHYGEIYEENSIVVETGVRKLPNDTIFYGIKRDNLRDGFGGMFEADGHARIGMWDDDQPVGEALYLYPDGDTFALFYGSLENGKFSNGTAFLSDGRQYNGTFSDWNENEFNGIGTLRWPDGRIYSGHWKKGGTDVGGVIRRKDGRLTGKLMNQPAGFDVKSWADDPDKMYFYGVSADADIRNANGILFNVSGSWYSGEFKGGVKCGHAIAQDNTGNILIGEWKNGYLCGQGVRVRKDIESTLIYIGGFEQDLNSGKGVLIEYANAKWALKYCGEWQNGTYFGIGLKESENNQFFVGSFVEGSPDGDIEIISSNGQRKSSKWKNGIPFVSIKTIEGPGPEREEVNGDAFSQAVAFNSLKKADLFNKQMMFVGIRSEEDDDFQREVLIEPGFDYEVQVNYFNNADPNLPGDASNAVNTLLKLFFTEHISKAEPGIVSAILSADNAIPHDVWDCVKIKADEDVSLSYKIATAKIWNNGRANSKILPQSIFYDEGALLGFDALDGVIQAGDYYSGHITFMLHAGGKKKREAKKVERNINVPKPTLSPAKFSPADVPPQPMPKSDRLSVRVRFLKGTANSEEKSLSAALGEEVKILVRFTNNNIDQDFNVLLKLPEALEYQAKSSKLKINNQDKQISDDWILSGFKISDFPAGSVGEITFLARFYPKISMQGNINVHADLETEYISMHNDALISLQ